MSAYFSHQAVTIALFSATIGAWVVLELQQSVRTASRTLSRDGGSYYVLVGCVAAGWIVTARSVDVRAAAIGAEPVAFIAGLAVTWLGIALRGWSFHTLGRDFTFKVRTRTGQPVVSSGPYRVVRHPGYSALVLVLIGVGLLYGTWIGVAAMAILPTVGLIIRIRIEERVLTADLGSAYSDYAAGRKRLIPHVW